MIETDSNAAWADSDAPDVKVIYAQLLRIESEITVPNYLSFCPGAYLKNQLHVSKNRKRCISYDPAYLTVLFFSFQVNILLRRVPVKRGRNLSAR